MPSRMPATVNTPPTTAHVVVTKWYHARRFSATMICTGDSAYENCAARARRHCQARRRSLGGSTAAATSPRWSDSLAGIAQARVPRAAFPELSHDRMRLSIGKHATKPGVRQVGGT